MKNSKIVSVIVSLILIISMMLSLTACIGEGEYEGEIGGRVPINPHPPVDPYLYTYDYNEATSNNTEKSLRMEPENIANMRLVVPKRDGYEFDGWYADWLFKTQVSDEQGRIVIQDDKLLKAKSNTLFAKWRKDDAPIYPILMVYVTKIDTLPETIDGKQIKVDYSMTQEERSVCRLIPPLLEDYLNAMMNGFVKFKVDTFFTTRTL